MIAHLPGSKLTARVALAQAMEAIQDGDKVFIVTVRSDGETRVKTSDFSTRDIITASGYLQAEMTYQILRAAEEP